MLKDAEAKGSPGFYTDIFHVQLSKERNCGCVMRCEVEGFDF